MLDDRTPETSDLAADISERPAAAGGKVASFVLFVGAGCRPSVDERAALGRHGARCLSVAGPEQARSAARLARFDAVVLDADAVGTPFAPTLARLSELLACPMIVIAGSDGAAGQAGEDFDEIMALELGADVYLRRPVLPRCLRAHLVALMRRQPPRRPQPIADAWPPWRATQRLAAGLAAVSLKDTEAAVLQCLVAAQGRIVTRAELLAALPMGHGQGRRAARTIDVYVHRLRRCLANTGTQWPCIGAVRGRGYILMGARNASAPPLLRTPA